MNSFNKGKLKNFSISNGMEASPARTSTLDVGGTALQRAEDFGLDLSLMQENLRLTPEERMLQNDRLVTEIEQFRRLA
jgi:hypothetical protein